MYAADRKKWSISALEILSICLSVEDSLLRVPTRKHPTSFVNLWFCAQTKIGNDLQFRKTLFFTTVLITNNGRLDQRTWFLNDILEEFFGSGVHTLRCVTTDTQRYRELKTPPAPLHLRKGQRVWYVYIWCSKSSLHTRPFKATSKQKYKLAGKNCVVRFHY